MRGVGRGTGVLLALLLAAVLGVFLLATWALRGGEDPNPVPLEESGRQAEARAPHAAAATSDENGTAAPSATSAAPTSDTAKPPAPAAAPRPPDEGIGRDRSVAGRVLDSLTGRPIAGARVTMSTGFPDGSEIETRTDSSGRFRGQGLPRSRGYWVSVEAPGFVSRSTTLWNRTSSSDDVTVSLSQSSRVFGRVSDPGGKPVAGARVYVDGVYGRRSFDHKPESQLDFIQEVRGLTDRSDLFEMLADLNSSALTDASGRFEVDQIPVEQDLTLMASAEGFSPSEPRKGLVVPRGSAGETIELVLRPDTTLALRIAAPEGRDPPGEIWGAVATPLGPRPLVRAEDGTWVSRGLPGGRTWFLVEVPTYASEFRSAEVEPGQRTQVDLLLGAGDGISGRVVDAGGGGVEGLRVSVRTTVKGAPRIDLDSGAVTDAAGGFAVQGLAHGEYRVHVEASAFGLEVDHGVHRAPSSGLLLPAPGTLRFRIVPEAGGSLPAASALVVSHSQEGDRYLHEAWREDNVVYDAESGSVEVRRTFPGKTTLAVKVPDFVEVRRTLAVPAGGTTDFGDVVLVPSIRVRGRVRDHEGKPVPNAEVTAWYRNGVSSAARCDIEGAFELRDLAPGAVTIEVADTGNAGKRFALASWKMSIQAGMPPLALALVPGGAVRVRVLDATGNPATVAHVACEPEGDWYRPVPLSLDPDETPGEFVGRRPPGPRVVQVLDPEMPFKKVVLASSTVEIREKEEAFVEIRLPPEKRK